MSTWTALVVGLALLAGNAFFVGAEFAVISARRSQIEPRAAEGSRRARRTLWAMEHVSLMLACAQLGITVCSLGLGAVAEPALASLLHTPFERLGVPPNLLHPVAFALALTLVVYLHVVVGEMVPKNLALAGTDRVALVLAPALVTVARVVSPVIRLLNGMANGVLRLARVSPKDEVASAYTAEDVQSIVAESHKEGLLEAPHDLLNGALEFSHRSAGDVMVPLSSVVTLPSSCTPAELERLVGRTGYSRFPVLGDAGELTGYLHLKDVLYAHDDEHAEPIPDKRVRALVSVAATDEVEDALAAMQGSGAHLARVLDRSGRTVGVLFLEDVLEELVGEIVDATQRG
ncbi:MAG TPA: hemolysin family protein [Actinomycetales bacterium]|nr:hemolysin family protein [Actinomycetales bacterium]